MSLEVEGEALNTGTRMNLGLDNLPSRKSGEQLRLQNPDAVHMNSSTFSPNPITLSPTILPEEDSNDFDHLHTINMGSETEDMLHEEIIIDRMYMKAIELRKRQSLHKTQSPTKVFSAIVTICRLTIVYSVN